MCVVQASSYTAHALLVGAVCGVLLGVALWFGAPAVVSGRNAPMMLLPCTKTCKLMYCCVILNVAALMWHTSPVNWVSISAFLSCNRHPALLKLLQRQPPCVFRCITC